LPVSCGRGKSLKKSGFAKRREKGGLAGDSRKTNSLIPMKKGKKGAKPEGRY